MRIFVTGADGFIGSHLVEALRDRGDEVTGLALYNSFDSFGWMDEIDGIRKVRGDVRDAEHMRALIAGHDIVFHLAALISVPHSFTSPRAFVDTNVTGTLNVLMAARDAGAKVVNTSTSEVYGTALYTPMDETHPKCPQSPYAASKVAADALVMSFAASYGMENVILRPFNTYGPRQSERAVIASVCRQLASGDEVLMGNQDAVRDFVYVSDTVAAFLAVAKLSGRVFNAATGVGTRIGDLACNARLDPVRLRPDDAEVEVLIGDATSLMRETDWRPTVSVADGFDRTLDWWRSRPHRKELDYVA